MSHRESTLPPWWRRRSTLAATALILLAVATYWFALRTAASIDWPGAAPPPGSSASKSGRSLHVARLEVHDGRWRVQPGSARAFPFADDRTVWVQLWSGETLLVGPPRRLWPAGAPDRRHEIGTHTLDVKYTLTRDDGTVVEARTDMYGFLYADGSDAFAEDLRPVRSTPTPLTWNQPGLARRQTSLTGIDDGGVPVARIVEGTDHPVATVDGWRRAVLDGLTRLSEAPPAPLGSRRRDREDAAITDAVSLAALLGIREALPLIDRLGDPRRHSSHSDARPALANAETVLTTESSPEDVRDALETIMSRSDSPAPALNVAECIDHTGTVREQAAAMVDQWAPRPASKFDAETPRDEGFGPRSLGAGAWLSIVLVLTGVWIETTGASRDIPARKRSAIAWLLTLFGASVVVELPVPGATLTTATLGLLGAAYVTRALTRRTSARVSRFAWTGFATAGLLLPLAEHLASPVLDAVARALVFVSVAALALAPVRRTQDPDSRLPDTDAPPARPVRETFRSLRWLLVVGWVFCSLALAFVKSIDLQMIGRLPSKFYAFSALVLAGAAVAVAAGTVLHVASRNRQRRELTPWITCTLAVTASVHGIVLLDTLTHREASAGFEMFDRMSALCTLALIVATGKRLWQTASRPATATASANE